MKTSLPVAATLEWTKLGLQWMEMMAASSRVIERRTRRAPTAAQWMRMGNEKVEAAIASSSAMGRHMAGFPMNDALSIWHAWARMLASGMAPYHARATRNARSRRKS